MSIINECIWGYLDEDIEIPVIEGMIYLDVIEAIIKDIGRRACINLGIDSSSTNDVIIKGMNNEAYSVLDVYFVDENCIECSKKKLDELKKNLFSSYTVPVCFIEDYMEYDAVAATTMFYDDMTDAEKAEFFEIIAEDIADELEGFYFEIGEIEGD